MEGCVNVAESHTIWNMTTSCPIPVAGEMRYPIFSCYARAVIVVNPIAVLVKSIIEGSESIAVTVNPVPLLIVRVQDLLRQRNNAAVPPKKGIAAKTKSATQVGDVTTINENY